MNEHSKVALQVALTEKIQRRQQLYEMAEQYELRAVDIRTKEIIELDEEIRSLQADLD